MGQQQLLLLLPLHAWQGPDSPFSPPQSQQPHQGKGYPASMHPCMALAWGRWLALQGLMVCMAYCAP